MDLHKAFGTEPRKSDEPANENTIRFAYQAVASHLRPLIRDRCSYHIIDDAAARELLAQVPAELAPPEGAELRLADMRLADGAYELQPHLQRWRDTCEEAELWDDKTIISTVLRGGRYQVLGFRAILQTRGQGVGACRSSNQSPRCPLAPPPAPGPVLPLPPPPPAGSRGGCGLAVADGGCLFRVLWQPEARHPHLELTTAHLPHLQPTPTPTLPLTLTLTPHPLSHPYARAHPRPHPHPSQARRLVLNTLAFAVEANCRGQGIGTRLVDVLGLLLKAEAVRATKMHGELDDSVMLVDALEPDFYAKVRTSFTLRAPCAHPLHVEARTSPHPASPRPYAPSATSKSRSTRTSSPPRSGSGSPTRARPRSCAR